MTKRERSKRKDATGKFVHTEFYKFTFPNVGTHRVKLNTAGKDPSCAEQCEPTGRQPSAL